MRKYLYAGAVAGGLLLLGAGPAFADVLPSPINAQQGSDAGGLGLLGSDGALGIESPLDGTKVLNISPGQNSADLTGAGGSVLPDESSMTLPRTGMGAPTDRKPAAGVAGRGLPVVGGGLPVVGGGSSPLSGLPISNLLGGGLLGGGGLGGGSPLAGAGPLGGLSQQQEAGLLGDNMSLLGGLGGLTGLLPVSSARTLPAVSGMPAGGTAVAPSDTAAGDTAPAADDATPPADTKPAGDTAPAKKPAADPATATDSRLHEEPIDPEGRSGATDTRKFSAGRPVAGVDSQFK